MTDLASIEQGDDFWARVRMALGALRPPAREGLPSEGPAAAGSPLMVLLAEKQEGDASVCGFTEDRMLPRAPLRPLPL